MRAVYLPPWAVWIGVALAACSGGGASEALPIDAALGPDAEDLCGGELTIEGHVFDLASGAALFDHTLAERGEPGNATTSAPNGRAILCVDRSPEVGLDTSGPDAVSRTDRVSSAVVGRLRAAGQAYPFGMFTEVDLTALASDLGVSPPGAGDAWLAVHVVAVTEGAPLVGARVELSATHGGVYSRAADGSFVADDHVGAGGVVLFVDVDAPDDPPASGDLTITPPGAFGGACDGPATVSPVPAVLNGAGYACE